MDNSVCLSHYVHVCIEKSKFLVAKSLRFNRTSNVLDGNLLFEILINWTLSTAFFFGCSSVFSRDTDDEDKCFSCDIFIKTSHTLNNIVKVFNKIESALFALISCLFSTNSESLWNTQIYTLRACEYEEWSAPIVFSNYHCVCKISQPSFDTIRMYMHFYPLFFSVSMNCCGL